MELAAEAKDELVDAVNSQHSHFTKTLEEVRKILQPNFSLGKTRNQVSKGNDATEKTDKGLANRVDNLTVEEPSEQDTVPSALRLVTTSPSPALGREVVYDVSKDDRNDDNFFAPYCLFLDLQALRTFASNLDSL